MLRSSTTSYYAADGLGSITSLSNTSGSNAATYTYDSFGNLTASTGSLTNPFRYTAREFDPETSLYYYRARYYDLQTGRFVSEDPLGLAAGINSYSYAGNEPGQFADPTGLDYHTKYDPTTNTINVTASVLVYGSYSRGELAASWQRDTNRYWNAGSPKYGKCNVKFTFTFSFAPGVRDNGWNLPHSADNYVRAEPSPFWGNSLGMTFSDHGYWWQGINDQDVAHEMGHLLGLDDDYGRVIPDWLFNKIYGNHDGHMMSNSLVRNVAQHEIDEILAGKACQCK